MKGLQQRDSHATVIKQQ